MKKRILQCLGTVLLLLCVVVLTTENSHSQWLPGRVKDQRQHRNGKLWVYVTNFGQFGSDQQSGAVFPGAEQGTETVYINRGGIVLGGIIPGNGIINPVGTMDTLVSAGPSMWSVTDYRELEPHYADIELSKIRVRSTLQSSEFYDPDAVSPEDFIAVYTDTFTATTGLGPPKHMRALGLEVEEKSYQFSEPYAEDIVFFDLTIRNIGRDTIRQFYTGFFADNDVGTRKPGSGYSDNGDNSGFMEFNADGERVNTAWAAQSDGDYGDTPGCVGVHILRPTEQDGRLSYNWWMSDADISSLKDWGPRTVARNEGDNPVVDPKDPWGSPEEDEDKYVLLCNGSIDPPQYNYETSEWNPDIPPGPISSDPSRFMISFGPFGTDTGELFTTPRGSEPLTLFYPGDSALFTYAIIGGEGDSTVSAGLGATDPQAFVDLGVNAVTAQEMFDNGDLNPPEIVGPPPLPSELKLLQNYPNPFNPETIIEFELPMASDVTVKVYNVLGQLVKTLAAQQMPAGDHTITWNGTNDSGLQVSSGVYIYRLQAGEFISVKKMALIR
ncbi:FlgD immunoglobulin-like domain containing protein [candidate division KSB1 bacterium]